MRAARCHVPTMVVESSMPFLAYEGSSGSEKHLCGSGRVAARKKLKIFSYVYRVNFALGYLFLQKHKPILRFAKKKTS
jgi:hypothetical protein